MLGMATSTPHRPPEPGQVAVPCAGCGATAWKWPCKVRKAKRLYCGAACQRAHRTGDANPNWRGGDQQRTCRQCGKVFSAIFAEAARGKGLFCTVECRVAYGRIHPDFRTARKMMRHRRECRLRATRETLGTHTDQEWQALLARYGGRCAHCGTTERIERDHIIPLSKGGDDTIDNLQPLCGTCNRRKWNKLTCKAA